MCSKSSGQFELFKHNFHGIFCRNFTSTYYSYDEQYHHTKKACKQINVLAERNFGLRGKWACKVEAP